MLTNKKYLLFIEAVRLKWDQENDLNITRYIGTYLAQAADRDGGRKERRT